MTSHTWKKKTGLKFLSILKFCGLPLCHLLNELSSDPNMYSMKKGHSVAYCQTVAEKDNPFFCIPRELDPMVKPLPA
jgi:hypothetical protein